MSKQLLIIMLPMVDKLPIAAGKSVVGRAHSNRQNWQAKSYAGRIEYLSSGLPSFTAKLMQ